MLQLPVKTRWGTYARLAESIASKQVSLKSAIWSPGIEKDATLKDEANRLKQILLTEDFWLDVNDVKAILFPLAQAINAIEGNEVDSRKCYKTIKQAFSSSKAAIENCDFIEELKEELMEVGLIDLLTMLIVFHLDPQRQSRIWKDGCRSFAGYSGTVGPRTNAEPT